MIKFSVHAAASLAILLVAPSAAQAYTFGMFVPQEIRTQMTADLEFMASVEGEEVSALHEEIFGKMDGKTYHTFFDSRVTRIGMNACGGGNAVACVIPLLGSSKMWLTENYTKFDHPQVSRMMVVYHEARHTETDNSNWPHATCPTPFLDENGDEMKSIWTGAPLAGEPACDETPYGSYGSSTILLKNISKFCDNCSEKVREDAGMYADDQLGRVIDVDAKAAIRKDLYDTAEE